MTVTFHVLWVLCALGSVALAAAPGRAPWTPWATQIGVGLGLAAGVWWLGPRDVPGVEWVGLTVLAIAATRLARLTSVRAMVVAPFVAGVLSAVWMSMLRVAGLPLWAAVAIAAAPPMVAAYLTPTRPRFAPAIVRDEALLITMTLGLVVAAAPRIVEGWRSAVLLNIQDTSRALVLPAWTVALAVVALSAGGVYSLWRRG
jgi:hypothetical protein